jgi:hypothetical protein
MPRYHHSAVLSPVGLRLTDYSLGLRGSHCRRKTDVACWDERRRRTCRRYRLRGKVAGVGIEANPWGFVAYSAEDIPEHDYVGIRTYHCRRWCQDARDYRMRRSEELQRMSRWRVCVVGGIDSRSLVGTLVVRRWGCWPLVGLRARVRICCCDDEILDRKRILGLRRR